MELAPDVADAGKCQGGRCLASLVIIGAMKSGTGVLMRALSQQAGLVSGRGEHGGREVHFFGSALASAANSTDSYLLRFPRLAEGEERVTFDKSPDYMRSRRSLHQLSTMLPSAKLVVLLRDPAERAVSEFQHNCRHGRYVRTSWSSDANSKPYPVVMLRDDLARQPHPARSFQTLRYPCHLDDMLLYYFPASSSSSSSSSSSTATSHLKPAAELLSPHARKEAAHGYYAQQLEWVLQRYPSRQVLLLFHEHLQSSLEDTLARVLRFLKLPFSSSGSGSGSASSLGVDDGIDSAALRPRAGSAIRAKKQRHAQLERLLQDLYRPHNAYLRELLLLQEAGFLGPGGNASLPSWLL